jgi:DNA repair exonuclease SbcCD ATPase subunit
VQLDLDGVKPQLTAVQTQISTMGHIHDIKYAEKVLLPPNEHVKLTAVAAGDYIPSAQVKTSITVIEATLPKECANMDIDSKITQLAAEKAKLDTLPTTTTDDPAELLAELTALDSQLSKCKIIPIESAKPLQQAIRQLRENATLQFNNGCAQCTNNKKILAKDLATKEAEYADYLARVSVTEEENKATTAKLEQLRSQRLLLSSRLDKATRVASALSHAVKLQYSIDGLTAIVEKYAKYKNDIKELQRLKVLFSNASQCEKARETLEKHTRYTQYLACQQRDNLRAKESKLTLQVELLQCELDKSTNSANLLSDKEKVQTALLNARAQLSQVDSQLGATKSQLQAAQVEYDIYVKYTAEAPRLQEQVSKYKLYTSALSSPGLKTAIISRNISRIVTSANDILASVTDFTISADTTDNCIELYIKENAKTLPLSMGSKYQLFITSIALRLAIVALIPSCADFVIIDEGFGCMDGVNISKITDLFVNIATSHKFIFVISHVLELQNAINTPLYITDKLVDGVRCGYLNNTPVVCNNTDNTSNTNNNTNNTANNTANNTNTSTNTINKTNNIIPAGSVECTCGKIITRRALAVHMKTSLHLRRLNKKNK